MAMALTPTYISTNPTQDAHSDSAVSNVAPELCMANSNLVSAKMAADRAASSSLDSGPGGRDKTSNKIVSSATASGNDSMDRAAGEANISDALQGKVARGKGGHDTASQLDYMLNTVVKCMCRHSTGKVFLRLSMISVSRLKSLFSDSGMLKL